MSRGDGRGVGGRTVDGRRLRCTGVVGSGGGGGVKARRVTTAASAGSGRSCQTRDRPFLRADGRRPPANSGFRLDEPQCLHHRRHFIHRRPCLLPIRLQRARDGGGRIDGGATAPVAVSIAAANVQGSAAMANTPSIRATTAPAATAVTHLHRDVAIPVLTPPRIHGRCVADVPRALVRARLRGGPMAHRRPTRSPSKRGAAQEYRRRPLLPLPPLLSLLLPPLLPPLPPLLPHVAAAATRRCGRTRGCRRTAGAVTCRQPYRARAVAARKARRWPMPQRGAALRAPSRPHPSTSTPLPPPLPPQ
ncbi:hypothetical protein I4F81_005872 [Pyropia yezoensis]|uniref:Uncharacterized protein n=1 Tax=Pyropia yezoensis TaxID=2788 RepID=A0ACC3BZ42_PYRYE|nr:hypothetical protein I4F81_005872 [Neopyropia yezoensis]